MNMKPVLFIFICFIISFISSCSSATNKTVNWWCAQTPYNQTCNHYIAKDNPSSGPLSINQFLNMTVLASIDEAHMVLKQTRDIEYKYPHVPGKSLWQRCVDYFDGIVYTLNMVHNHTRNPTPLDVQTWISGGLTYISMCKEGFELINMTNTELSIISTNLTKLLLNSLDISARIRGGNNIYTHGIADWNFIHEYNLSYLAEDKPDVVVAQDGSGDFTTIHEAVDSWGDKMQEGKRYVIYVKAGVYEERVMIHKEMWDITIFGDGIDQTIITGDGHLGGTVINTISAGDLHETATFQVWGSVFIARDITFRNTAGAELGQAVAFVSSSDKSAFYRCSFEGYQDTLYTPMYKQFYKECKIYGTVDFIFGNSLAVFQDCEIFFRIPIGSGLVATAQARKYENEPNGYSFQGCKIMAGEDLKPIIDQYPKAYLGRPWHPGAITVFMQSFLDDLVDPEGWLDWDGDSATAYYGEYENYGPGSSTDHRVNWIHVIKDAEIAKNFTVENYINGNDWLPQTGVPFTPGLYNL